MTRRASTSGAAAPRRDALLAAVPDVPRWVETRAMLLSGRCTVLPDPEDPSSFVVCSTESRVVSVVGAPPAEHVRLAVEHNGNAGAVLAPVEARGVVTEALGDWRAEEAVIHRLPGEVSPLPPGGDVRLLDAAAVRTLDGTPPDLARDLALLEARTPVAVAFDGGQAAAFCDPGWETESLWDVSVDTLERYRGRGHAAAAARALIERMSARGLRPVWGAVVSNQASRRVAGKLGFVAVDRLLVFLPGSGPAELPW